MDIPFYLCRNHFFTPKFVRYLYFVYLCTQKPTSRAIKITFCCRFVVPLFELSVFLLITNRLQRYTIMVLNYIWIAFFVIAFIFALIGLTMGDTTIFQKIVDSTFDSSKNAFEVSLGLTGVLALWLGIMKIGEKAGDRKSVV